MLDAQDVVDILADRQNAAEFVDNNYARSVESYTSWKNRVRKVDDAYSGATVVKWPDMPESTNDLHIPNYVQLAAEDRARSASAVVPSLRCDTTGMKAKEKTAAEKRERIGMGYWGASNIRKPLQSWALDSGIAGLAICKVMPDYAGGTNQPLLVREDPRFAYPSPNYAQGPYIDDIVFGYDCHVRDLIRRFPDAAGDLAASVKDSNRDPAKRTEIVTVMEFYSADYFIVACHPKGASIDRKGKRGGLVCLMAERNPISRCPVVIGTRTASGEYHGDFDWVLPAMHTYNTLVTMSVDEAIRSTYAEKIAYNVRNPLDGGPDAVIELESRDGRYEYVNVPSRYANFNDMRQMENIIRTGTAFSPSRSGDPNESVISAAGINAAQGQNTEIVRAIQRFTIAPMIEAATSIAFEWDEVENGDKERTVYGEQFGTAYAETYTPSKDIAGNHRCRVTYGLGAGLDEVNQNSMVLMQYGSGFVSRETAMELSPFVQNPVEEAKRIALEQIDQATLSGLIRDASLPVEQGGLDPTQLAAIRKEMEKPDSSLHDAILEYLLPDQPAPLAAPPGIQAGPVASPGQPGVAEPQEAGLPPLEALMGA